MTIRRARGSVVVTWVFAAAIAAATILCWLFFAATHDFPPIPEPDRVALVWKHDASMFRQRRPFTLGEFRELADSAPAFAAITATSSRLTLIEAPVRREVTVEWVSDGFVDVVRPVVKVGRLFSLLELRTASRVALISFPLWRDLFGADPHAIGRWLQIEGEPYEIVGVMPDQFWFPRRGGADDGVWIPFPVHSRPADVVDVTARLAPDGTMNAAVGQLNAAALDRHLGLSGDRTPTVVAPITDEARIKAGPGLTAFIGPAVVILLVTWANAAMLLLMGAVGRQRELAVRAALGASRARLVSESILGTAKIVLAAAVSGGIGAYWLKALLAHAVEHLNPTLSASMQGGVLLLVAIVGGLAVLTIPAAGLIPALAATKTNLTSSLAGQQPALRLVHRQYGIGDLLLIVQVALAIVLVLGAAFLLKAFNEFQRVGELHYDAHRILIAAVSDLSASAQREQVTRVAALPTVEAAALASNIPNPFTRVAPVTVSDDAGSRDCMMATTYATPSIFDALGLRPRGTWTVGTLVVSETAMRRCWNGNAHAHARVIVAGRGAAWLPVSAVVPDAYSESMLAGSFAVGGMTSQLYIIVEALPKEGDRVLLVRTRDLAAARDALTRALPREAAATLDVADARIRRRIEQLPIGVFGLMMIACVTLLIAASGVYAALRYAVIARMTEIGIRRALGAPSLRIVTLVTSHHAPLIVTGAVAGLIGGIFLTNVMWRNLLILTRSDPRTVMGIVIVLAAAGAAAMTGPVVRALRINPADVLRAL